jgi:hypothetical protein
MLGAFFDDCFDFFLTEELFCYKVLKFWKRLSTQNVSLIWLLLDRSGSLEGRDLF